MLRENGVRNILNEWRKFEPFRKGWYETDVIPVGEVQRLVCRALEVILGEENFIKDIWFCRQHRRIYFTPDPSGCEKCLSMKPYFEDGKGGDKEIV